MPLRRLGNIITTFVATSAAVKAILGDPQRRAEVCKTTWLGADMLRGGLRVETTHPLSAGTLHLRSLLQLDGDFCTTVCWRTHGSRQAWPSAGEIQLAIVQHSESIDLGLRPLRDLVTLTTALVGFLASLTAVLPTLGMALTDVGDSLRWAVSAVSGVVVLVVSYEVLRRAIASGLLRYWRRDVQRLEGKEDARRGRRLSISELE